MNQRGQSKKGSVRLRSLASLGLQVEVLGSVQGLLLENQTCLMSGAGQELRRRVAFFGFKLRVFRNPDTRFSLFLTFRVLSLNDDDKRHDNTKNIPIAKEKNETSPHWNTEYQPSSRLHFRFVDEIQTPASSDRFQPSDLYPFLLISLNVQTRDAHPNHSNCSATSKR